MQDQSGKWRWLVAGVMCFWLARPGTVVAEVPQVLVTVKPVHSLVAGVMAGVGEPDLLLSGGESPHAYAMRPSAARKLARARLIFWLGADLETFVERPLRALAGKARVVQLATAAGLALLSERGSAAVGSFDPHVWLDPANATRIVAAAVAALREQDPANAARYAANGQALAARLDALDRDLEARLTPLRGLAYVVFHDGYQYFERRYGLNQVGSLTLHAGQQPGAGRLRKIRRMILNREAGCVFAEPQFEPALVKVLVEGTDARTGVLDPIGADLPAGPGAYFTLMRRLADALRRCLAPAG